MNIFPLFFAAAKIGVGRGPFYFATTKIRIGRGPLLRQGQAPLRRLFTSDYAAFVASCPRLRPTTTMLQAGHSVLQRQKVESDAERCCGRGRRHSGGFLLRIMPPSWHPVPACAPRRLCCRRAILLCDDENLNRTLRRCDYDCCRRNCSTLPARCRCIDS